MMFTVFHLIHNRKIPGRTVNDIRRYIAYFEGTAAGAWLKTIHWRGLEFRYADLMQGAGVGGAQTIVQQQTIYLCDLPLESPENLRETWELYQFYPTIVHELRHYWQMRKFGWLYILGCLPVLRNLTIEKDAYRMQHQAEDFFNSIDAFRCAQKFRERMEKQGLTDNEKAES